MSTGAAGSLLVALDRVSRDVRAILGRALDGAEVSVDEAEVARRRDRPRPAGADARRRRAAPPARRRRRHLRRQPQHQLHQRLHQALRLLRLLPRPPRGGGLPAADRRGRAARAGGVGSRRHARSASRPGCRRSSTAASTSTSRARSRPRCPELHLHAFSPEEVLYGSVRSGLPIKEYLAELKDGRPRHPARHLGGDPRSGDPRSHRARPHHRGPVGRGDHHRARARHPHDLDHHVRPRRDARPLGAAHGAAARHPEGHRRLHRVRAALAHPQRGADVLQGARARRAARRHRRRGRSACTRSRA